MEHFLVLRIFLISISFFIFNLPLSEYNIVNLQRQLSSFIPTHLRRDFSLKKKKVILIVANLFIESFHGVIRARPSPRVDLQFFKKRKDVG